MDFTVIGGCVEITGDGNDHFVDRSNRLITVSHVEGNRAKVAVLVHELSSFEVHVGCTDIRTGSSCRSGKLKISCQVKRITDFNIVSFNTVLGAIKGIGCMMTDNGHCHIDRVDFLITISYFESHNREVVIIIHKLFCCQPHIGSTNNSTGSFRSSSEGEVTVHIVQRGICCGSITAHIMTFAIVICGVIGTNDGYSHIDRVDRLVPINNVEGNIRKVRVIIAELASCQPHIGCTGIGTNS